MDQQLSLLIDISKKEELRRSNPHYCTRLYSVPLTRDWDLDGSAAHDNKAPGSALSSMFKKGQRVIMKVFLDGPEEEKKPEARRKCQNELDMLRKLNEEAASRNLNTLDWLKKVNIVTLLGFFKDAQFSAVNTDPFVVLELGECSLGHLLHHRKSDCPTDRSENASTLDPEESSTYTMDHCFTFLCQIFAALNFIHKNGLMHRDLKSYNVLLFNNRTLCKLCDFEDCREVTKSRMTAKMGTTWWRAPELFSDVSADGKAEYGFAADWFSFGLVMCEALFREEPFACYYTGRMGDRTLDPSSVYDDQFLRALPKRHEIDSCAMYIDTTKHGMPKVVLDKSRCVFPYVRELHDIWSLIDSLLSWDPNMRPTGKELKKLFRSDVARHCTGSPTEIILTKCSTEESDSGTRMSETVISYNPSDILVYKIQFKLMGHDLTGDASSQDDIIKRFKEHTGDILFMIPTETKPRLYFSFLINDNREMTQEACRFILKVACRRAYADSVREFCSSEKFLKFMSKLFKTHSNDRVRGITFQAVHAENA